MYVWQSDQNITDSKVYIIKRETFESIKQDKCTLFVWELQKKIQPNLT